LKEEKEEEEIVVEEDVEKATGTEDQVHQQSCLSNESCSESGKKSRFNASAEYTGAPIPRLSAAHSADKWYV
jgi:hypothetical protein